MQIELRPHRQMVLAEKSKQKLFLLVKFSPGVEEMKMNVDVDSMFVIDISGSMTSLVPGTGKSKLKLVKESMKKLTESNLLKGTDKVGLISYDTEAKTELKLKPYDEYGLNNAVDGLHIGGGTLMGKGMDKALKMFDKNGNNSNQKMFLFTDGETWDEETCKDMAKQANDLGVSIVSYGVGEDYNENLMMQISETTKSNARHITDIKDFFQYINEELAHSKKEAIKDASISFHFSRGFEIEEAYRVFPSIVNYQVVDQRIDFGNLACDKENTFILNINCPKRPESKIRIAKVTSNYTLADGTTNEEVQDVLLEYTDDEMQAGRVDKDVMFYLQQYNVQKNVEEAVKLSKMGDNEKALTHLTDAGKTAIYTGNDFLVENINKMKNEIAENGKISPESSKTVVLNGRTTTMSLDKGSNIGISEEEIRHQTGV